MRVLHSVWGHSLEKDTDLLNTFRVMKLVKGLENKTSKEWLRELL